MKNVTSEKQLSGLLLQALRLRPVTNGRAFAAGYRGPLEKGSLSAAELSRGLALAEQREGFIRLHFWFAKGFEDAMAQELLAGLSAGTYVCEGAFRPGDAAMQAALDALQKSGFSPVLERIKMEASKELLQAHPAAADPCDASAPKHQADAGRPSSLQPAGTDAFFVQQADPAMAFAIGRLFKACYDPVTGCLPTEEELAEDCERGLVSVLLLESRIAAALHLARAKNTLELRHIAVEPALRGRGLATALLCAMAENEDFERVILWTSPQNAAAVSLYEKTGFQKQDYFSKVLLLQI